MNIQELNTKCEKFNESKELKDAIYNLTSKCLLFMQSFEYQEDAEMYIVFSRMSELLKGSLNYELSKQLMELICNKNNYME